MQIAVTSGPPLSRVLDPGHPACEEAAEHQRGPVKPTIDLESWLETHARPFVVIDDQYRIVAMNLAYEKTYRVNRAELVGRPCFSAVHRSHHPCHELGEACPYKQVFQTHEPQTCLHTHYDGEGHFRWVRVRVHALRAPDGKLYVGEELEELAAQDAEPKADHTRLVGKDPVFLRTIEQLDKAARANAPVLLQGETGTGKELAAAFIHRHSSRCDQHFIALDCTVLTENLFESEVFGHEKGAFTGSVGTRKGLFELADGGTLFLDEIGEMSLEMQAKLLRVLETGQFRRVGGHQVLRADVRVICATNRPLWDLVQAGLFRADIYYRVACFCIRMPPLRERLGDVPVLAEDLLKRIGKSNGQEYRITHAGMALLQRLDYPGNIRELRNVLETAAAYTAGREVDREALAKALRSQSQAMAADPEATGWTDVPLHAPYSDTPYPPLATDPGEQQPTMQDLEARYIQTLLRKFSGHRRKVAECMGISERTLYRKLKLYNLE